MAFSDCVNKDCVFNTDKGCGNTDYRMGGCQGYISSTKIHVGLLNITPTPSSKIDRIYENDDFIIDILETEDGPMVRVSIFEDGHFVNDFRVYKNEKVKKYCE